MPTTAVKETKPLPGCKSPWVIAWLGLVVVVLAVNAVMVYLAIATNPGLVVEDYYERGRNMERTMFSKDARDPGWVLSTDIPQEINAGELTKIRFFLVDKAGQPVTPDAVDLYVYRPSDAKRDFSVVMTEEAPGRYMAEVFFPLVGIWDTLVAARNGEDEHHIAKRIEVKRP